MNIWINDGCLIHSKRSISTLLWFCSNEPNNEQQGQAKWKWEPIWQSFQTKMLKGLDRVSLNFMPG